MVNITREFAPPFKLIAPYFIIGTLFYLISNFLLFIIDVEQITTSQDLYIISWTHLFLLGFVMMIIFGAMAQLIPVVLEKGHFSVDFYYIIYPLLSFGILMMAYGFIDSQLMLSFGGGMVLISMFIFSFETFLTLTRVEKFDIVTLSVILSNIFLTIGVIVGFIMALTFAGFIVSDIASLLKAHVYLIIGGYVLITIMAFSYVLIPMFGLSHGFSKTPLHVSIAMQSFAVVVVFISSMLQNELYNKIGYLFSFLSVVVYFYFIFYIYKTRARKQNDMYMVSLFIGFIFFAFSLIFGGFYITTGYETYALLSGWLLFVGFFGFLISGHLYKIVPFLVWYERFSPLVGKQKVPMLTDMVPVKSANFQIFLTAIGIILYSFALFFQNGYLQMAAALFLSIGALFLFFNLIFMIRFK